MTLMVKDVLDLKSMREFRLAAGKDGLSRPVQKGAILDYEFDDDVQGIDEGPFSKFAFVTGSLLFAKNDEKKILKAVQEMYTDGVSALAVKTVVFKNLPEEVLRFADEKNFPIFLFDTSYFEDIIAELHTAISDKYVVEYEIERLNRLMAERMDPEEVRQICKELHPALEKWIQVYYCITPVPYENNKIQQIFNHFMTHPQRRKNVALFYFRGGFLFFVSDESRELEKYWIKFSNAVEYAGLYEQGLTIGSSSLHEESGLNQGVLEAICACEAARLKGKATLHFEKLGSLRILLSGEISPAMRSFSEDYLRPLQKEGGARSELMKTAIAYIKADGSIPETARTLYIHENTARYRIGKMRAATGEEAGEHVFFQNLSMAVWIHLIQEKRKQAASNS